MSNDYGFHWVETTTPQELAEGRRTYMRGARIDPAVEPWTIETSAGLYVGWVDQDNQNRWLAPDRIADGWRRLFVEKGEA